jgi:hypothetical protein
MRKSKVLRAIGEIALVYHFEFAGMTAKGHYRWVHKPTGRSVVSIRDDGSWRSIKNSERDFKRCTREIRESMDG